MKTETAEILEIQNFNPDAPVQLNVTDKAIADIKQQYMGLTITGVEDKAGYKAVYAARQVVKKTRVDVKKYADTLKEKAVEWQRKVNGELKRVTAELETVEDYLQIQEDEYNFQLEKIRQAKEEEEKAVLQIRVNKLAEVGVNLPLVFLQGLEHEQYEQILKESTDKYLAEKLQKEQDALKMAELAELAMVQAEKDKAELEQLRKQREAVELERKRVEAIETKRQQDQYVSRTNELQALGMLYNKPTSSFQFGPIECLAINVDAMHDIEWNMLVETLTVKITELKAKLEKAKQEELKFEQEKALKAEIERQKAVEAEIKVKKAEALAMASDKEKLQDVYNLFSGITIHEMKSARAKGIKIAIEEGIEGILKIIKPAL